MCVKSIVSIVSNKRIERDSPIGEDSICTLRDLVLPLQGSTPPNNAVLAFTVQVFLPTHAAATTATEVATSQVSSTTYAPQLPVGVPYDANTTEISTNPGLAVRVRFEYSDATPHTV